MVGTGKVKTEACADVINDEDNLILGADFSDLFPEALRREGVVIEVAVVIRLRDESGNLVFVFLNNSFKSGNVVPGNDNVVANVLFKNAGIVLLHAPGRNAVVIAAEHDDLFPVRMSSCAHNGALSCVVAVLCKERPVCRFYGVNKNLGALKHNLSGRCCAVAEGYLLHCGCVNVFIAVTENVRTVSAHIVDIFVAVNVPHIGALCFFGKERPV